MRGDDDEPAEDGDSGPDDDQGDYIDQVVDCEMQARLWVRTLLPVLQLRAGKSCDPDGRNKTVETAIDLAVIAASDRIARICRGDVDAIDLDEEAGER